MTRLSFKKRLVFSLVAVVIGLGFLEGVLNFFGVARDFVQFRANLPVAVDSPESHHARHDPDLGWVHIPDRVHRDFYGSGLTLSIGKLGLRNNPNLPAEQESEQYRVVCLGDSFTLGYGVDDAETFPVWLQSLSPRVQVINMGQGGYSVGQCYLWFRRLRDELKPGCVVLSMIVDDIWRMQSTRMMNGYSMPHFQLEGDRLVISGQPVPRKIQTGKSLEPGGQAASFFLEHTAIGQTTRRMLGTASNREQADARNELLEVAVAIIQALQGVVERSGGQFVLVLLPELRELIDERAHQENRLVASRLQELSSRRGIPFLDLTAVFAGLTAEERADHYLDEQWHHFSSEGNQLTAERLHTFLIGHVAGYPSRKK